MRFILIDPHSRRLRHVNARDLRAAQAGVKLVDVDHGTIAPGISIVTDEYALCRGDKKTPQKYFALNGQLYGGPAVLYGFDNAGETMDVPLKPIQVIGEDHLVIDPGHLHRVIGYRQTGQIANFVITWLASEREVELAIMAGVVERPTVRVNGLVIAAWPNL